MHCTQPPPTPVPRRYLRGPPPSPLPSTPVGPEGPGPLRLSAPGSPRGRMHGDPGAGGWGGTGEVARSPAQGWASPTPVTSAPPAPPPGHPCAPSTDLAATPPGKSICKGGQSGAPPSLQGPLLSPLARPTPVGNGVAPAQVSPSLRPRAAPWWWLSALRRYAGVLGAAP